MKTFTDLGMILPKWLTLFLDWRYLAEARNRLVWLPTHQSINALFISCLDHHGVILLCVGLWCTFVLTFLGFPCCEVLHFFYQNLFFYFVFVVVDYLVLLQIDMTTITRRNWWSIVGLLCRHSLFKEIWWVATHISVVMLVVYKSKSLTVRIRRIESVML